MRSAFRGRLIPPIIETCFRGPGKSKGTILVVEDDDALRTFYRSSLMIAGYEVIAAEDGVTALHLIDSRQPDLVVLDLGLPRLSGYDVRRELAAQVATEKIPVVIVTGETRDFSPSEFPCVLRKPVTPDALIGAVEKCLA